MNEDFVVDILNIMEQNNVILAFTGEFDMRIIDALIISAKEKLHHSEKDLLVQKKIYNVMVECLENIFHQSEDALKGNVKLPSFAIFTLRREGKNYFLVTGNYIADNRVEYLKSTIDKINSLNKAQRWDMYRETLINSDTPDNGGGGLGIMDISLKSGNQLEYSFKKLNENNTFYIFKVCIHSTNN